MDLKEIRQLIRFLSGTDVSEIEICENGQTVRIHRAVKGAGEPVVTVMPGSTVPPYPTTLATAPITTPAPSGEPARSAEIEGPTINSPMVGTFYLASSPESPPFVSPGDRIEKGSVVCIIEAMKLMNEIESELSGRVVRILKNNAAPVEYGEPLFLIEAP